MALVSEAQATSVVQVLVPATERMDMAVELPEVEIHTDTVDTAELARLGRRMDMAPAVALGRPRVEVAAHDALPEHAAAIRSWVEYFNP